MGDGNGFCNWLLWAHGGVVVDENGKVAINSKETIEALKYAKELYQTFIPGTLSWLDVEQQGAYVAGEIGADRRTASRSTSSLRTTRRPRRSPRTPSMRACRSARSASRPRSALRVNAMVFKHTKFPNAAKEYLRFMMEAEQYDPG